MYQTTGDFTALVDRMLHLNQNEIGINKPSHETCPIKVVSVCSLLYEVCDKGGSTL